MKIMVVHAGLLFSDKIEALNATDMKEFLESLGGWPILGAKPGGHWNESTFGFENDLVQLRVYGVHSLINVFVAEDAKQTDQRIINVSSQGLVMS